LFISGGVSTSATSFLRTCERFARAEPIVKPGALPLGGRNHKALELTGAANETYASAA